MLNYYGPHPNSELLRRYGYVTARHARYDVVEVPWALIEQAVAEQLGLPTDVVEKAVRSTPSPLFSISDYPHLLSTLP